MYKTLEQAKTDPQYQERNVMIKLDAEEIEKLDFKEVNRDQWSELEGHVDFVPARIYPRGMWHETGEVGHDFKFRYFTMED